MGAALSSSTFGDVVAVEGLPTTFALLAAVCAFTSLLAMGTLPSYGAVSAAAKLSDFYSLLSGCALI